jgi:hypothetical protein
MKNVLMLFRGLQHIGLLLSALKNKDEDSEVSLTPGHRYFARGGLKFLIQGSREGRQVLSCSSFLFDQVSSKVMQRKG